MSSWGFLDSIHRMQFGHWSVCCMFVQTGTLLLSQLFSVESVQGIKCRTYEPPRHAGDAEKVCVRIKMGTSNSLYEKTIQRQLCMEHMYWNRSQHIILWAACANYEKKNQIFMYSFFRINLCMKSQWISGSFSNVLRNQMLHTVYIFSLFMPLE